MAIDEAIMTYHAQGLVLPTLRFYGWNPATVTLGYFQRAEREVDKDQCEALGIDIVRRLTGGRAVLHDEELTYSVIISEDHSLMPNTVTESYKVLSQALLEGFHNLGLEAELAKVIKSSHKAGTSSACFDAPSTYELVIDGKKIVGSAQVRKNGVILQHGSILNHLDVNKLFHTIKMDNLKLKERIKSSFLNKATSINHVTGKKCSWEVLCHAFYDGFQKALNIELEAGSLTPEEIQLAQELVKTKYSTDEWNYKR